MPLTDPSCTGCGRASAVLATVELSGRSATTRDPITTIQLCPRCYRTGGYGDPPNNSPTRRP